LSESIIPKIYTEVCYFSMHIGHKIILTKKGNEWYI